MAGWGSRDLKPDRFISDTKGEEIILMLREYEEELEKEKLIEAGVLKLPSGNGHVALTPLKASRYLKSAMIGWGRERYVERLQTLIRDATRDQGISVILHQMKRRISMEARNYLLEMQFGPETMASFSSRIRFRTE